MKSILIVGVETIVGGHLAAALAKHHHVAGLSSVRGVAIAGCEIRQTVALTLEDVRGELARTSPDLIVVCGPAAESVWSFSETRTVDEANLNAAPLWARAAAESESRLIVISSDAVFHGPWMFHEEDCTGCCDSSAAKAIRAMEVQVLKHCPSALVVRSNVFGWSPQVRPGWIETLLNALQSQTSLHVPSPGYATPIEAAVFAELVIQAWDRGLEGVYHVGGSERANFVHFAHRLAQEFQLPRPCFQPRCFDDAQTNVFGHGETSLNSGRFRRTLGTSIPMLSESLRSLREQSEREEGQFPNAPEPDCIAQAA